MINVEPGYEGDVLRHLKALDAVEDAYVSYGVYDLVLRVKAKTVEELKEAVMHKIRATDQVRSSLTLIIQDGEP